MGGIRVRFFSSTILYISWKPRIWWDLSMMPTEVESFDHSAFASFDGNPNSAPGLFDLESYGAPLAPMMTPELEAKINKKTTN